MSSKPVVISFGRSAAITQGHHNNFMFGKRLAEKHGADYHIHLSQTLDNKKNPIPHDDKVQLAKDMMPHLADHFKTDKDVKTIFDAMKKYSDKPGGTKEAHIVVGADRKDDFEGLLHKYNGKDYHYGKIHVHSSGDRVEGVSGTDMRNHAISGDFESFAAGIPNTGNREHAKRMYDKIREVMLAPVEKKPRKRKTVSEGYKSIGQFLLEAADVLKRTENPKKKKGLLKSDYAFNPPWQTYQQDKAHKDSNESQPAHQTSQDAPNGNY